MLVLPGNLQRNLQLASAAREKIQTEQSACDTQPNHPFAIFGGASRRLRHEGMLRST
jgi:hypothetical protein